MNAPTTKLGINQFHRFMRGEFAKAIEKAYKSLQIFCEADLQSYAWHTIKEFLEGHEEAPGKFRVLNKPFLCRTYPDLVVFRKRTVWVIIELKESKSLSAIAGTKERGRILRVKKILHPKRAYLVYVARYGNKRAIPGAKQKAARFFFEVPIVLAKKGTKVEQEWRHEFKHWSKFVTPPTS
ncbi:MAG TPA: hypothetical protein VGF06_14665 [Terriglobales bacterium]|jgi:hypothetical protein